MLKFMIRWIVIIILIPVFTGCAHNSYQSINTGDFPALRKNHDLSIGWRIKAGDRYTELDGYVLNNRYFIMQDLELWITLLDSAGSEKERKSFFVIPTSLSLNNSARFQVEFTNHVKQGDRIRFLYRYKGVEGHDETVEWMNSFEEVL